MSAWEMIVGLEVHVQLRTRTKIFCGCPVRFGDAPNANTCPVCLALPGALPVLNAHAVTLAVRAALALECTVHPTSVFARKNYFYPDLPKGYQITQGDRPFATGGRVVLADGTALGITRIHMEEDAGKSVHDRFAAYTAVDLNRAGTPLIEIVGDPVIRSAAQAVAFLKALREILLHLEVSDVSMEEGSFRCDANVSARRAGEPALRTRTEIKNLNSFAFIERAIGLEYARHVATYESGGTIAQQTMLYDESHDAVRPARSKEGSHDYRYFPEPDLPPLVLTSDWIEAQRASVPELPAARRSRWIAAHRLTVPEAEALSADRAVASYFERTAELSGDGKATANWVLGEVLAALKDAAAPIDTFPVEPSRLSALIHLVRDGTLSGSAAKTVFKRMRTDPAAPAAIAERDGLLQVSDDTALLEWIEAVWAERPDEAARFVAGERKLQGVLVGFVMKKSGGRADPRRLAALLAQRAPDV